MNLHFMTYKIIIVFFPGSDKQTLCQADWKYLLKIDYKAIEVISQIVLSRHVNQSISMKNCFD